MTSRRTVDLLPEIFRTDTNRKFLSATLDQLTQEPRFDRTRGYVGRRIGPGVNPQDNYVRESTAQRANYQLEPGVVFLRPDTNQAQDAITYPGMIDTLSVLGADTDRQDRLFQSDYYTWDPFCDLDKFTNYSQYYWLPGGPEAVDVGESQVPLTDDFTVSRGIIGYDFSGVAGTNPVITLARGGNYRFTVNQPGHGFWIQSAPGVNGRLPATPNISSRDVLGVSNNGDTTGTITFDVPLRNAQDFYYNLVEIDPVDLISEFRFDQLNNRYVDQFLAENPTGIDGITNLDSRTVIFPITETDPVLGGWQINSLFDPLPPGPGSIGQPGSFDSLPYSETQEIVSQEARYGIWRINYVPAGSGRSIMQLSLVQPVPVFNRFRIRFGTQYSSTNWFKNSQGFFERIPLLTAVQDTLWYQDSTNPEIFGVIQLVDPQGPQLIDIEQIIGSRDYVSSNGVVFSNGLKVQFRGPTNPPQFQDLEYYVEGVGTGPGINSRVGFVDGEAYFGPFHVHQGQRMTGAAHTGVSHQIIWDTLAESLANPGAAAPQDAPLPRSGTPGATQGNGIRLVPVRELVTPETYTGGVLTPYDSIPYDITPFDETLDAPLVKDYITINRSSRDRNAWSRSNRWFHIDVIRYSAERNNTVPLIDNRSRGSRPIIEFRANLRLWDFGTQGKLPVNIVDFDATDALSDVNGSTGYSVDGYEFLQGTRVIFAADLDKDVRNRVYRVDFIDPDGEENTAPVIHLVPEPDGEALADQTVVATNGLTQQGRSFWFDGINWRLAQQKTGVNQAPLFDVYDSQGRSFGDRAFYPSTTFAGNRLFGYALGGTQITDRELGFALKYLNINNVGDIVFQNYLYTDRFQYVQDRVGTEAEVGSGFVRQYRDRVDFSELTGWLPAATQNRSRQTFRFTNTTGTLILDVPVDIDSQLPPVQIFLDGVFVDPNRYTIEIQGNNTFINLLFDVPPSSVIEANVLSDQPSAVGFYQVPINLENNALNQNSAEFTLGTIRTHYETIGQNLRGLQGPIVGANNTRDLGDISIYGQNIIQNSSPLTLAGVFLREPQYDIAQAIRFNSQEYEKYKAKLMDAASRGDFVNATPTQILDACLQELSLTGQESGPFYWSDMIPAGETYTESRTVYSLISTPTFDTNRVYDFSSSNFQSLLIFVNGDILTRGYDYTVSDDAPTVTITRPLVAGDVIVIREYATTFGSFVPNTPTKMGLYPAFRPRIFVDTSYITPQTVIQGHDGSITLAYGDARDQVLLEFETRIYNNLKVPGAVPLVSADVTPGQWRQTDYDLSEINSILSTDFLSWIGWNKIDYTTQLYDAANAFTFNYSQSSDRINGSVLLGAWRGIYQYFYDTTSPDTRPWEMLGLSEKPSWWESRYGPAPYTSGNLVLWEDLAQGIVRDPQGEYVDLRRRRPGLLQALPVGSEGELLPPSLSVMGDTDALSYQRSWTFGDGGPAESAWRTSSSWPFAVMRLLVLTKPAQFFSLFADRDRYRFDAALDQFLWDQRYRLDAKQMAPLYGSGVSRASYINWIIDYNRQLGVDSTRDLEIRLENIDLRLCWRLGAFSDKRFLKIFTERSTPTSLNASLLLPDESYQILLYENPAFASFQYSSVIVQQVPGGWTVFGYSTTQPYFNILTSRPFGVSETITAGDVSVQVSTQHSDSVVRIPYGYVFRNRASMCDFIISYGKLLQRQGMTFEGMENGYVMDWQQMAQEFLYWSTQGWIDGSMINLNPASTRISITRPNAVAQSLVPVRPDNVILNQNRQAIAPNNLVINRLGNTISFEITGPGNDTINYFGLRFTAYEHMVVLDNRSIFADLIYDPVTGARQSRVLAAGVLSADWDGTVNAPGFVLNQNNIRTWSPNQIYTKGEIVRFKDDLWTASTIIQPSEEFDYTVWLRSDYDEIQQGLLPNAATASDQLAEAYSVYQANLEREVDLFSYGLIGFRPRQYMADLDLDDVSQVNLYQQFLGSKGTRGALEIFSQADLGKESAEYDVYEYWSIRRGFYGATANRSYFELVLDPSRLTSDPSIIEITQPGQASQADQTVLISNIWKSSYVITDTNILPLATQTPTDRALPGAGYVNFDDVDIAVFDLDSLLEEEVNRIEAGTTVWTAADGAYDWNVYRAESTPGRVTRVSDNLDGSSSVTFSSAHGLSRGDVIVIRFFSPDIDGAYRVRSVPSIFTVTIDYSFPGSQSAIESQGIALRLVSARIQQASDLAAVPNSAALDTGSRIWVDQSPQGQWTVLEKIQPFSPRMSLLPELSGSGARAGTAVAQGFSNLSALVGAPGYNPDVLAASPGAVIAYARDFQDQYRRNDTLVLSAIGSAGYGNALDIGDQQWAVSGASDSNNQQGYAATIRRAPDSDAFQTQQLLTAGDLEYAATRFGESVTISRDERWIGIGAPGDAVSQLGGACYIYARVDVQPQSVTYVTDGFTTIYNYSDYVVATDAFTAGPNPAWQFTVFLDDVLLQPGTDYITDAGFVILLSAPVPELLLRIARRTAVQLDQREYLNVPAQTLTGLGSGARFDVNVVRGSYSAEISAPGLDYAPGDQLLIPGTALGGLTPANDLILTVTAVINTGIADFDVTSGSGVGNTTVFSLDRFFAQVNSIWDFTVSVNGVLQRPYQDYDYNTDGDLVFLAVPPVGAIIDVAADTHFVYVDKITAPAGSGAGSRFGTSVTTTTDGKVWAIGAPGTEGIGRTVIYSRDSEKFLIETNGPQTLTTVEPLISPTMVKVNGQFLLDTELNIGGEFTVTSSNQVQITRSLQVGDVVEIATNQFRETQTLESQRPQTGMDFGARVDQCVNDCSLYVAAPRDSGVLPQAGSLDLWQNQTKLYGSITSQIANPTLTPGDIIYVNGYAISITGTSIDSLIDDIQSAGIPNATAVPTQDLHLRGDGVTAKFAVGDIYSSTQFVGAPSTVVRIDSVTQIPTTDYTYDNEDRAITFVSAPERNSDITVVSGRVMIMAVRPEVAPPFNRLSVYPGSGTLWQDLGLDLYVWQQTIESPQPQEFARFGSSISISDDTSTLAVGAPGASTIADTQFDQGRTVFDGTVTAFADAINQSGAVYVYDFLPAYQPSVTNPGQFVFGHQIIPADLQPLSEFGAAVNITTGTLLAGAPRSPDNGVTFQEVNESRRPIWSVARAETPQVNINLLNTSYIYDIGNPSPATYLDYFDPLQGRLLGAVAQNIDYIGAVDPASYNVGPINNRGNKWAQDHVGRIWWDTTRVRFVDANQGDVAYSSRRWGQIFPGSRVEIFQWISSDVPPSQYTGPGTPRDVASYVLAPTVDPQGIFRDIYYFWVSGLTSVDRSQAKTLSIDTLTRYIEDPKASGIPYLAPLSANTVALYNCREAITQVNSILHVEFDQVQNDAAVHVEYQLVAQGRADSFLDAALYRKLLDSFCGADTTGAAVPSPFLSPSERYGIAIRPQQSMFVDRFAALENYLTSANAVLAAFPVSETRSSRLLDSAEPEPSATSALPSDRWDQRVLDDQELSFQDLAQVPLGYRYLVSMDAQNQGLWTIYEVMAGTVPGSRDLQLQRVQNYDTRKYWRRIDWYQTGYDPFTRVLLEVPRYADLSTLQVPAGSNVRVTANSQGKWEIYRLDGNTWVRVALESGTIEFDERLWNYQLGRFGFDSEVFDSQYFDQEPVIETRRILEAINQELLIDDLLIERNRLLILMFNYILSEQISPDWLTKTSLIDVDHTIRNLQPFQIYRQDNQDFVLQYINEVKPYHVQIREFGLIYRGTDTYPGSVTDFDLPARWDPNQRVFVSPVLDDTGTLSTTSSTPSDAPIWQEFPWNQWYQNYLLNIQSVRIVDGGSGYTVPPQVEVSGESLRPAQMTARINSAGQVIAVDVIDPGDAYSTDAVITITGGNGTGAQAVAVMGNTKVRSIVTRITYDRYQYSSSIIPWQPGVVYTAGDRVRYQDRVWQALPQVSAAQQFDPDQWQIIPAGDLTAADRVMGYYAPTASQPGLDLAQLISGIDYPGVQVAAPDFNQNTGFDVGNFDINPFDNISFGPEGLPTYDPAILDTIYESEFTDPFLGVLPAPAYAGDPPTTGPNPITIDGGAFVDTYSSHAPPELIPGAVFDTLDLRVLTTPGADWADQGRGFPMVARRYQYDPTSPVLDYSGLLDSASYLSVFNATTGVQLTPDTDYSVTWSQYQITVFNGASTGDILAISLAALGGGNQIFARSYLGSDIGFSLILPVRTADIADVVIFANDRSITNFTYESLGISDTLIQFSQQFFTTDVVNITVLGNIPPVLSWSMPRTQYIVADGSDTYTLDNSLVGANPANAVVTIDGLRARPYAGKRYISNGMTSIFALPEVSDVVPSTIAVNDVSVFVNDQALILGIDFFVDPWDGVNPRTVTLTVIPTVGSRVLIAVRTGARYRIVGNDLVFLPAAGPVPTAGSVIAVTTFNDLQGQDALTTVSVGPSIDNSYAVGQSVSNSNRLTVTVDGSFLFSGLDYNLVADTVVLTTGSVGPSSVVAITSFTENIVSQAQSFRVFQDMRGRQLLYRILPSNSTELLQDLSATADTISVKNATLLDEPNLSQGIFGIVTINGERITYRNRDTVNNTISGLRRGTAGTGAADHVAGSAVLGMGSGNLLPAEYQRKIEREDFLADGSQTVFVTQSLMIDDSDSTLLTDAVQVFVAGTLQTSGYSVDAINPVQISFDAPPTAGYQVSVQIQQARVMYQQGIGTASDGVPLQQTMTDAAKFIRGQ